MLWNVDSFETFQTRVPKNVIPLLYFTFRTMPTCLKDRTNAFQSLTDNNKIYRFRFSLSFFYSLSLPRLFIVCDDAEIEKIFLHFRYNAESFLNCKLIAKSTGESRKQIFTTADLVN